MTIEEFLVALIPSYEAAAMEARVLGYLWMTWPDIVWDETMRFYARSFA